MACGFSETAAKVMIANWFPTRKGLALGWATMGNNLSSATIVPLLLVFISWRGVNGSYQIVGIIMAVVAVFFFLCTRSTSEELGIAPDNGEVTPEKLAAIRREAMDYKSPWTVGKMLKTKQLWLCGLGYGSMIMITVAEISQLIPRLTAGGWSTQRATGAMTVCALLGLVGSYGTGWLDQKIGCKKTSLLCASWFLLSVIFCILPSNDFTLSASVFFLGFGVGAVGNLFPSMLSDLFNRHDFVKAVGIANVMVMLLRSLTFSILAFGLAKFGSFNGAFILFAIISVIGLICLILLRDERITTPTASDRPTPHSVQ